MDIVIASKNIGKVQEFQELLKDLDVNIHYLSEYPALINQEANEYGETLMENAIIKAKFYYDLLKTPVIADDTGLFIDALFGEPGVKTARFASNDNLKQDQDALNRNKVLSLLKNQKNRNAYFQTVLVYFDGLNVIPATGHLNGSIALKEKGEHGFGYDKIFYVNEYQQTLAELDASKKNQISHRYKASLSLKLKLSFFFKSILKEDYLKQLILDQYHEEVLALNQFHQGMSNYTYLVNTSTKNLVVRIPGYSSEIFVDRLIEEKVLNKIKNQGPFMKCLYYDNILNISICEYYEKQETSINQIYETLKILHHLDSFDNDYLPFKRLAYYERLNKILNIKLHDEYYQSYNILNNYYSLLNNRFKYPCHNDCQLSNFIGNHLIDFEFSGNNDILYDYACFGNNDIKISYQLVNLDKQITNKEEAIKIVDLWYGLQALSWYLVALYKDKTGFSESLKMDFNQIGLFFLDKAMKILNKYDI